MYLICKLSEDYINKSIPCTFQCFFFLDVRYFGYITVFLNLKLISQGRQEDTTGGSIVAGISPNMVIFSSLYWP